MRVLVVGAGAIGCSVAIRLGEIADVSVYTRRSLVADRLREGLSLTLLDGSVLRSKPTIITSIDTDDWDVVFVCVRAYDLEDTLHTILPSLKSDTPVVALTNGIVIDMVRALAGDRGVCASVDFGIGATSDSDYFVKIDGDIRLGDSVGGSVASAVRDMISDVISVEVVEDIVSATYAKLIINSIITYTAVVTGALLKDIIANCREVLDEIIYEAYAVARASGIDPASYRKISFRVFCRRDFIGGMFRSCVWKYMTDNYGDRTSTTASRIASGMKSEVDYITGYVVSLGKKVGKPTPINEAILDMVKKIECGMLTPDMFNLTGLIKNN